MLDILAAGIQTASDFFKPKEVLLLENLALNHRVEIPVAKSLCRALRWQRQERVYRPLHRFECEASSEDSKRICRAL